MNWLFTLLFFSVSATASEFKVLSWNTFLIPPPLNFTSQNERTIQMKTLLPDQDHDVMFFQEAFYDKKRQALIKALAATHPFVAVPKRSRKLKHLQDSGLFIVSKFPLKVLGQVIFKRCAREDCFSSKSALLVEVTLPSQLKVQMINTHLQAWDKPKSVAVRTAQLQQIKELMATHETPGVPQILMGDINIDGKLPAEYGAALNLLDMTSTPLTGELDSTNGFPTLGCFKKPGADKREWLDHLWLKANGSDASVEEKRVRPMTGFLNQRECPLSDHYAIEAIVKL